MTDDGSAPRLVLASGSPRRRELLTMLGLHFTVQPADVDETYGSDEEPGLHAERLAREKAAAVARMKPGSLVIGSDTVVAIDGAVLGKPRDGDEAVRMLLLLAGREHEVATGIAVAFDDRVTSAVERVRVRIRAFDERTAREYAATGEGLDKAGGYGIQGYGSTLVEGIEGDYFAVMGLPVSRLMRLLEQTGWRYDFGTLRREATS
jgi:septum formation protein